MTLRRRSTRPTDAVSAQPPESADLAPVDVDDPLKSLLMVVMGSIQEWSLVSGYENVPPRVLLQQIAELAEDWEAIAPTRSGEGGN